MKQPDEMEQLVDTPEIEPCFSPKPAPWEDEVHMEDPEASPSPSPSPSPRPPGP
jgi:hypothetical protein